jgi:hypothetical protein
MKTTLLALGATALFGVTAAQAATITLPAQQIGDISPVDPLNRDFQTNWSSNPTNMNDTLHFNALPLLQGPMSFAQFDDQGGTRILTKVEVTVSGAWNGELRVENVSSTNDTDVTRADLQVRFAVDVLNDYDGNFSNNSLIELSGFVFDTNYDADLNSTDSWSLNPPGTVPFTLAPGQSFTDDSVAGSFTNQVISLTSGLDAFIGAGTWDLGCSARAVDIFTTDGGSPNTGQTAYAECGAVVTYTWQPPNDTPIPAPIALLATGLLGIGALRRLRR